MRATHAVHRAQRHRLIERGEAAAMLHRQGKEIGIGQLVVPEQMFEKNHACGARSVR